MFKAFETHNKRVKHFRSPEYNYTFDRENGLFMRWGKTPQEDPEYAPFPEILDLEVSTICGRGCKFCYKSNTKSGKNMSFETFKTIFDKMPIALCQIAFGVGDIDANPDLWKMFDYCRNNGRNIVIPNITINGWNLTDEHAKNLVKYCGSIAVSRISDSPDVCYNAVEKLTHLGCKQCNIHIVVSAETADDCFQLIEDTKNDKRLAELNATLFLTLKPKGRGTSYHSLSFDKYSEIISKAIESGVKIGFDSCGANNLVSLIKGRKDFKFLETMIEPCESSLFSSYINTNGEFFPCSFCEGEPGWEKGIDVVNCKSFSRDVWMNERTVEFGKKLICSKDKNNCRKCVIYEL